MYNLLRSIKVQQLELHQFNSATQKYDSDSIEGSEAAVANTKQSEEEEDPPLDVDNDEILIRD